MIIQNKKTKTVFTADILSEHKKAGHPVDCPLIVSNGQELDPDGLEILFLTKAEYDLLPDWWKDNLTRETLIMDEPTERVVA